MSESEINTPNSNMNSPPSGEHLSWNDYLQLASNRITELGVDTFAQPINAQLLKREAELLRNAQDYCAGASETCESILAQTIPFAEDKRDYQPTLDALASSYGRDSISRNNIGYYGFYGIAAYIRRLNAEFNKDAVRGFFNKVEAEIMADRESIFNNTRDLFVDTLLDDATERGSRAAELLDAVEHLGPEIEGDFDYVAVPVAIHNEDTETILTTLEQLSKQVVANNTRISIFANCPESEEATGLERYTQLVKAIRTRFSDLSIDVMFRSYGEERLQKHSMMAIRSDQMDAILLQTAREGTSAESAVTWIDADTTKLPPTALGLLQASVKEKKNAFAIPNLRYSVSGYKASTGVDISDPINATAANELARRLNNRTQSNHERIKEGEYIEEAGLTFQIGIYAMSGGVDPEMETLGESSSLFQGLIKILSESIPVVVNGQTYTFAPRDLLFPKNQEVDRGGMLDYISEARMYTSARRLVGQMANMFSGLHEPYNVRDTYVIDSFSTEGYRSEDNNKLVELAPGAERAVAEAVRLPIENNNTSPLIRKFKKKLDKVA